MIVKSHRGEKLSQSARFIALLIGTVIMVMPFIYMVSTSFKKRTFLFEYPPKFFPTEPTVENYIDAWSRSDFSRYFLNSLFVATISTLITVLFATMCAYGFARFQFFGKKTLFTMMILGLMVPTIVMIIPQFIIAKNLHLIDSFSGLIFFYVGGNFALNTFLMRGFMEEIPKELDDAMLVDGAGPWKRFTKLYIPLSKPAIATISLFSFLGAWDEFAWAMTLINSPEKRTLPIAIALFQGQHATSWGLVFAACVIALIPVFIVYLFAQKHFVSGLSVGAVKG
jgi:multiple sugar transport system permease protein